MHHILRVLLVTSHTICQPEQSTTVALHEHPKASVSPVRALVTNPKSLHSIRLFFRLHGFTAVSKKTVSVNLICFRDY